MAKPSKKSACSFQLAELVVELMESARPFQLAQLSVALAKDHQAPQVQFRQALQLLKDAERFLEGDESASIAYANSPADLALLMPKPIGWSQLLEMLNDAIAKRSGRANRVLTAKGVSDFLTDHFSTPEIGAGFATGDLFVQQLDSKRLSPQDADKIVSEWRSYRKEQTRKATVARKEIAERRRKMQKK